MSHRPYAHLVNAERRREPTRGRLLSKRLLRTITAVPLLVASLLAVTGQSSLATSALGASYSPSGQPSSFKPGGSATYTVTVKNTGTATWSSGGSTPVHLGIHFATRGGGAGVSTPWVTDQRWALPSNLAPGGSVTFTVTVTAPVTSGSYVLEYQMVEEAVAWFPQYVDSSVSVSSTSGSSSGSSSASSSGVYLGVAITNVPYNMSLLSTFEQHAGKKMAIIDFWRTMGGGQDTLPTTWLQSIHSHGSTPMITWLPKNSDTGTTYSLSAIASGSYDSIITSWAQQLKSYGGRVLIRWAHEMNGSWYPWGRQPSSYIAAWRHIHTIFVNQGASNVQWVWSPNTKWSDPASAFDSYYPGDAYVDWTALDSYNSPKNGAWLTFSQLFGTSYTDLAALTSKPIMIGETASAEASAFSSAVSGTKAGWITNTYGTAIPSMPRIKAVLWTDDNLTASEGCCDWRIESSSAAQSAFASAIASASYLSTWQ